MVVIIAGLGCLAALIAILVLSGFADVPCQDGSWDGTKKTCIPD
ncbi:hypothetical protein [Bosea sp. (in: a-proteobacteria)]